MISIDRNAVTELCKGRRHDEASHSATVDALANDAGSDAKKASRNDKPEAMRVCGLSVTARTRSGEAAVLKDVSFEVDAGEIVGVLGESGAGKTTLGLALLGVLPRELCRTSGRVWLNGQSIENLEERELRGIRGREIALLYQDASILNPYLRVGHQVAEVLRAHYNWDRRRCMERAAEVLAQVGLAENERIFRSYPHQLSGGQKQRVCVALALACEPRVVVADEPTASLDPATAATILELMLRFNQERGTSFLLISHDQTVLRTATDRLLVMYAGEVVESGRTDEIFASPLHPYTRALLRCAAPFPDDGDADGRWPFIAGCPPDPAKTRSGCSFEPRCDVRTDRCLQRCPSLIAIAQRRVRCFAYGEDL